MTSRSRADRADGNHAGVPPRRSSRRGGTFAGVAVLLSVGALALSGCGTANEDDADDGRKDKQHTQSPSPSMTGGAVGSPTAGAPEAQGSSHALPGQEVQPDAQANAHGPAEPKAGIGETYPWHTEIVATTFWVGEIFDANAEDGSQMFSTYDENWFENYGGCDGVISQGACDTERRSAGNGYFPSSMTPKENPFYLDLPFDDVNNDIAAEMRGRVVPWASKEPYASRLADPSKSIMKNRWVQMRKGNTTCYGQIQDAGPGEYHDADYVFGSNDERPRNQRYGGAGMDISPALTSCLGFEHTNGNTEKVDWRFVDDEAVPDGPWLKIVTTRL